MEWLHYSAGFLALVDQVSPIRTEAEIQCKSHAREVIDAAYIEKEGVGCSQGS